MTQRNEHVELALEELERYGLRGEISERGKHLEIAWVTPQGRRFVIAPKTPSDWRGGMNLRSDLRKLLRADNLQPKPISNLSFQKAMSLPKQPVITRELLLQNDVDVLTDLVFDLQSQLITLQDKMNSITVVSKIEFAGTSKPEDSDVILEVSRKLYNGHLKDKSWLGPFRLGTKQALVFGLLTDQFQYIHDIVKLSGLSSKHVNTILWTAKKKGFAESGLRGQWRRK